MRWGVLAGLVFLGVSLAWLARDPQLARRAYGRGSSLNTGPDGTSLARAYLAGGRPVASLARPISRADLPADAVVFRVHPAFSSQFGVRRARFFPLRSDGGSADGGRADGGSADGGSPDGGSADGGRADGGGADAGPSDGGHVDIYDRPSRTRELFGADDDEFVARGGRIVVAAGSDHGPLRVPSAEGELRKVFPALPGVHRLDTDQRRGLSGVPLADALAVFARGEQPAIARVERGRGDVWLLAHPELLTNARLASADHLQLLVALAGEGRPVFFDELAHGLQDDVGPVELLSRWGLGPACLLAAMAGLGWFWRRAVTLGPPSPWRDVRTESIDLAYAVGELYGRTLRPRDQLALHHARFVHEVQLRLGLSAARAAERAKGLLTDFKLPPEGAHVGEADLRAALAKLNDAFRRLRDGHRRRA